MRLFVLIVSGVLEGFIFAQRRFNQLSAADRHQGPRHLAYTGQQRTGETRRRMRAPQDCYILKAGIQMMRPELLSPLRSSTSDGSLR